MSDLRQRAARAGEAGAGDAAYGQDARGVPDAGPDGQAVPEGVGCRQADGRTGAPVRQVRLIRDANTGGAANTAVLRLAVRGYAEAKS